MKPSIVLIILSALLFSSCNNSKDSKMTADQTGSGCADNCRAKSKSENLSCKLTPPELQKRKETVLASLKAKMTERKELADGYAFKFPGTDNMLDELTEFI